MQSKFLHIIAFNIPYPPDYGGVIDMYYKIKSLSEAGIKLILHCFQYGRQPSKELENICYKVHYYPRHSGLKYYLKERPYIVETRTSNSMPENLLNDPFPVLFEGLHSTDMMKRCRDANKKVLFRAHNIEHDYYRYLSKSDDNIFRKLFFRTESKKLERYEKILKNADEILCISKHDTFHFEKSFGKAIFIPAFHKNRTVNINEGLGSYILYHGNLSVSENIEALKYITRKITAKTPYRFIIAGKAPSVRLINWLKEFPGVQVVSDPDEGKINHLISNAQINILFTFQPTGLKLKLLHSLYTGRHCLVNPAMLKGTDLEEVCHVVSNEDQAIRMIDHLMATPIFEEDIKKRKLALAGYSNRENAEKIIRLLG